MRYVHWFVLVAAPALLQAQTPTDRPALDFSGVIFGNFQQRMDSTARFQTAGKPQNKFDIARAYLNFRMPAGERGSIRITTDIFQQTNPAAAAYYAGWSVRLKYGYFQYDATRNLAGINGLAAVVRAGMLHNVVIDHVDSFWPRWFGTNALETHGFFASSDVGAASLLTLPRRRGEVYFTVTNGTGYTAGETDRFKDVALRFTLTPFANDSGFLRAFAISPWYLKGSTASQFVIAAPAQVGPVDDGLQKDRLGVFVGVRDRRLTGGADFSRRIEEIEAGLNTAGSPRTVSRRTSDLISGFALVRPLEWVNPRKRSRLGLIARYDYFKLDNSADPSNTFTVFGAFWDLNARTSFALDYQQLAPSGTPRISAPQQTWFLHWVANF